MMRYSADAVSLRIDWPDLAPFALRQLIQRALAEDLGGDGLTQPPAVSGDVSTALLQHRNRFSTARIVAREQLVVCGLPLVPLILDAYTGGVDFRPACADGAECPAGCTLATLQGPAGTLLSAERVMLNFLQHLSGIATLTRSYVDALGDSPTRLLDTRKTHPGYRLLEKVATAKGGGYNHRLGLFDRVMLKDNHLAAEAASYGDALRTLLQRARTAYPHLPIQLEVDHISQIPPALDAGVDIILLDNFPLPALHEAVALIRGKALSEASGGIHLGSLPQLANVGLNFISTGATVHQAQWKDIGMDWDPA